MKQDPPGALGGLRVLDLSRVLAGPLCSMILGDLGANVIKIERPGTGDDTRTWGPPWAEGSAGRESAYYLCANRNKRSVVADLRTPQGQDLVRRLAASADVLLENFAPGTLDGWGLGPETLQALNPRLIFCSVTGYDPAGPDAGRPGYDFAVQARAGWMAITGEREGEPMKTGVALVDVLAGQNAAIAILAALRERERSGKGQQIGVSLLDSALAGLVNVAQAALVTGQQPRRWGNAHATIVPYQAFAAADRTFVIAVGNDAQWRRLCSVLALHAVAEDPRFATNPGRVEHRDALLPLLEAALSARTAAEWIAELEWAGVPCALVQSVQEALAAANLWTTGDTRTIASPLRLARTPPSPRRAPPALGEHTGEVEREGWGQ